MASPVESRGFAADQENADWENADWENADWENADWENAENAENPSAR